MTAESCTGGWAAQVVTSVAGSSAWFERGFVTYSNEAKRELLGVQESTLRAHGAVSEETAREMAQGALSRGKGTVALAVTGVAGPGGGTLDKPVGMVCFMGERALRAQRNPAIFRRPRKRAPAIGRCALSRFAHLEERIMTT